MLKSKFPIFYKVDQMTKGKILSLFIITITLISIQSQLLAIDFGTQFIKASIVHSGAGKSFSIVENSKSERKFINSVIFEFNVSWAFTMKKDFTNRTHCPRELVNHKIASCTREC